jgi:hypothetical protein
MVAELAGIDTQSMPNAYLVKTGWAVRSATKTIGDKIIAARAEIIRTQEPSAVETATKWYTYVVAKCPIEVYDHEGNRLDRNAIL